MKIIPGKCSFASTTDYGKKIFVVGDNQMKRIKRKRQRQPSRGVPRKRFSENMEQIYRRITMQNCDFNKVARNFIEITLWQCCSPVTLLHIFRTHFLRNTSGWLVLKRFNNSFERAKSFIKSFPGTKLQELENYAAPHLTAQKPDVSVV